MLGATGLLWGTATRLFGRRAAFFAAALFAVLGPTLHLGAFATYDPMALFLMALAAWCACGGRDRETEVGWILAAAGRARPGQRHQVRQRHLRSGHRGRGRAQRLPAAGRKGSPQPRCAAGRLPGLRPGRAVPAGRLVVPDRHRPDHHAARRRCVPGRPGAGRFLGLDRRRAGRRAGRGGAGRGRVPVAGERGAGRRAGRRGAARPARAGAHPYDRVPEQACRLRRVARCHRRRIRRRPAGRLAPAEAGPAAGHALPGRGHRPRRRRGHRPGPFHDELAGRRPAGQLPAAADRSRRPVPGRDRQRARVLPAPDVVAAVVQHRQHHPGRRPVAE